MNSSGYVSRFEVFKEPRGAIKFVEIFLAICAFATTCDFSTDLKINYLCDKENNTREISFNFKYPFRIEENVLPLCHENPGKLFGNYSSPAQFYVFVGVLAFLLCIGACIIYVVFNERYETDDRLSKFDLCLSVIITALWFCASCAWADGVSWVKMYTGPDIVCNQMKLKFGTNCNAVVAPTYGGLNASLIFGFANFALWAAGLWFNWKDAVLSRRNDPLMDQGSVSVADGPPM